jgi:hypothetical protein
MCKTVVRVKPLLQFVLSKRILVKVFYLGSGPGGLAQELQAGLYRGIGRKAFDPDLLAQGFPSIALHEVGDDPFQGQAMEWVV